ncbi:N-acetylmuramoyl-L-alanine amidase family protein [Gelidibacter maritimus]|uniref:N-acetylmuramoyl-L-alanine amidase n=1 Tax=Gelidibacter maritimus TaxID=2761487 RepID=A0A7W2R4T6_9FLAO|nr:N-acetylmuramoyl-L-alanine amidase [Gelidibacter maritimus]MBA6154184.1 N-acetylmuramoyl-L-alanine amidase [Gelidibacter maritimus]
MRTHLYYIFVLHIILIAGFLTPAQAFQKNKGQFVVVLDAGHGGNDPGNVGNGYKEKEIALNIVLTVGKSLEKHPNIKVIYTRKTDVFVPLRERAKIANNADADLFVSVHCNSHNSSAHGTETFVLGLHENQRNFEIAKKENEVIFLEDNYESHYDGFDPNSPESFIGLTLMQEEYLDQSTQLARLVQDNFTKTLKRNDRGVKQAGFWVLHNTYMPSVLVETGFLTYKPEGAYLNSTKGQNEVALSIYKGLMDYKMILDRNVGQNVYKDVANIESITEAVDAEVDSNTIKRVYSNTTFKVQLAASSNKIEPKSYNFKGLKNISREKEGKLYKYYYGYTSDYNEIQNMAKFAKSNGYPTSFVVAYQNGKRVDLSSVINSPAN